jgi:hypothetical protein
MKTIKTQIYSKKDFDNVKLPNWQRWLNPLNVKSLSEAVQENGQLRDILICETKAGIKILTDGNHLKTAMIDTLKLNEISVKIKLVKDEEEARKTFVSFNTKGKSLKAIDYIVSYSGGNPNNDYSIFLRDILKNPINEKEVLKHYGNLFKLPALTQIFLGSNQQIQSGKANIIKNKYERILEICEYLEQNYRFHPTLIKHIKKNGKSQKLNGGSIIPVIFKLRNYKNGELLNQSNESILEMLIDFTLYHFKSMENPTFTKDAVGKSFNTYLKENE